MKKVIKVTKLNGATILIGIESIIQVFEINQGNEIVTKIESRHAMVTSNLVQESIEEVYNLINN